MTSTPDSSVLVPALAQWHPQHENARVAVRAASLVIAHVVIETFSVLTRLPAPHRISVTDAAEAVSGLPWTPVGLPADEQAQLVSHAGRLSIGGGAVYDGLIAAAARHHGLTVLTRDRRSRRTYELIGADYRFVPDL